MNNVKPLIFFGTLLYPLYTLPWIFKSMIKNEYFGYFLFSLFMALLAYLWIPYELYDLVRHYERFDEVANLPFKQIYNTADLRFFFDVYMWCIASLGLPKEFVPFSTIFITYFLLFSSLKKIVDCQFKYSSFNQNISFKYLMLLGIILLFLQIRFVDSASGMRNYIAFSIFIFAIIDFYLNKKIILPIILIFVSLLFHMAVLPLILLFLLSILFNIRKIFRIIFVISLLLLLTNQVNTIFIFIMDLLKPTLQAYGLYIDAYMSSEGVYGGDYYSHMNIQTYILEKIILPAPFYLAGIYLFFVKKISFYQIKNFLYILFSFAVLVNFSRTMFMRYIYLFDVLFIFVMLFELRDKMNNVYRKVFIAFLFLFFVIGSFGGFYASRDSYIPSWYKVLYIPAPIMFLESVDKNEYIHRGG